MADKLTLQDMSQSNKASNKSGLPTLRTTLTVFTARSRTERVVEPKLLHTDDEVMSSLLVTSLN